MIEIVLRIDLGCESNGVVLQNGVVISTTPRIKFMLGWNRARVDAHCKFEKWSTSVVKTFRQIDLFDQAVA
jgi:hypothetical protein